MDDFPYLDESTALGAPFNPNRVDRTPAQGFFFTRMAEDSVTRTGANAVRNVVLLGGSVAVDPGSGNVFNRVAMLRRRLQVPEPGAALGLALGAGLLAALARRRWTVFPGPRSSTHRLTLECVGRCVGVAVDRARNWWTSRRRGE